MEYFFPFFTTFLISALLTSTILSLRDDFRWILRAPTSDRWHQKVTPSFGGIAIFVAFTASALIFQPLQGNTWKLLLGGTIVFALGLWDDIQPIRPYTKLAGQIVVSCFMIILGIHMLLTWNPLFFIPLTLIWYIGLTNAFNLLDNMDGLASGIALVSTVFMITLTFVSQSSLPMPLLVTFAGAILGFLIFNHHPAKIFMGDCGSQFLGFMLAAFTILGSWQEASNLFLLLATPVLILAVPIFDTAFVTLNRKIHGRSVSQGGRDHTSHRLVALGLSERSTVWLMWGLSIFFGLVALFAQIYEVYSWVLLACVSTIFILVMGIFLTDVKVYSEIPKSKPERKKFPAINLLFKRRTLELIIDTILIGASYTLAYLLRYDWSLDPYLLDQIERSLPVVVATKLLIMFALGLYRGIWTYIDFEGFKRLAKSTFLASCGTILIILGMYRFEGFSRTMFIIDFGLFLAFTAGVRALLRALRESVFAFPESGIRLLIVGAGEACRFLLQEIRRNRQWNLKPVAIVDNDKKIHGTSILDIPVLGTTKDILNIVQKQNVDQIIITSYSNGQSMEEVQKTCEKSGKPFVTMQSLEETLIPQINKAADFN